MQNRTDFHSIEPDRDIILFCDDFMGDYQVEGRMIKYKHKPFKPRFCTWSEITNKYETDSKNWMQRNSWKYKVLEMKDEG